MKMTANDLKKHIRNESLCQVIRQKMEIDQIYKQIADAYGLMRDLEISQPAQDEMQAKLEEYKKISRAYGAMLEDVWGVSWQDEEAIRRHLDWDDDEIDSRY